MPAAIPKQLRIMKALSEHLSTLPGNPALGVEPWPNGVKVIRGKAAISAKDASDDETVISILEAPRPLIGSPAGEQGLNRNEAWTLLVQGWPVDDKLNPSDPAYMLKALVEMRLAEIVEEHDDFGGQRTDKLYMLGGDIGSLIIGQGIVRPAGEAADSRLAMFYLPLIVEIATDVRNPFK